MSEIRYHLNNNSHMVQFPHAELGYIEAENFRKNNEKFKGRRIAEILQFYPHQIEFEVVYKCGVINLN